MSAVVARGWDTAVAMSGYSTVSAKKSISWTAMKFYSDINGPRKIHLRAIPCLSLAPHREIAVVLNVTATVGLIAMKVCRDVCVPLVIRSD